MIRIRHRADPRSRPVANFEILIFATASSVPNTFPPLFYDLRKICTHSLVHVVTAEENSLYKDADIERVQEH
jgi:hypothetical protein